MMKLVTEFFDVKHDPEQISMNDEEREKLTTLHPATLSEMANEDGPIVWILLVPTTQTIMHQFLKGEISEKQLLANTPTGISYDAIYLCSASVLQEFRKKGLGKKVTVDAISSIRKDHPIKYLFYWPFSEEGKVLAASVARDTGLILYERK